MKTIKRVFRHIFAIILTVLYIPFILAKVLTPVILGLGYLALTVIAAILYIRLVLKVVDYMAATDKIGALIILLAAIILFIKMADFMLIDIRKFKKWLWEWGREVLCQTIQRCLKELCIPIKVLFI